MTPPGLAFASVSERARARAATATNPRFSLDWERALQAQAKGQTPFTPAISLVNALDAALQMIEADGLEARFAQTLRLGRGVRAAMKAIGLELYSPDRADCSLVTAALWPQGIDGEAIRRALRDRHGMSWPAGRASSRAGSSASARSGHRAARHRIRSPSEALPASDTALFRCSKNSLAVGETAARFNSARAKFESSEIALSKC